MALPAPSQPSSISLPLPDPEAYPDEPREYARALMQRKDEIEAEMAALNDVLSSHNADASTSLFDPEGYPRGDIDIYTIRHARSALARLTTDRHTVNNLLVPALQAAFSPGSSSHQLSNGKLERVNGIDEAWPERAIARVNSVAERSPAASAGLRAGDLIHSFGEVTANTTSAMQAIGALVSRSEGASLSLRILRVGQRVHLTLVPRSGWGGRGSLGCHILPV